MKKSIIDLASRYEINQIIKVIDDYLLKKEKRYVTLAIANNVLVEEGIFSKTDQEKKVLKTILEGGLIPHAYQTNRKPKQWRIPKSNKGNRPPRKVRNPKSRQVRNLRENMKDSNSNSFNEWYGSLEPRQKVGFKRLVIILAITLFIIIVSIIPDNRPELIKSLDSRYVGRQWDDFTYEYFNRNYGPGQPLYYHDYVWVYYYSKGDFSITVAKSNSQILEISEGRK